MQAVAWIDLLGRRTSYGYDANGFVNKIQTPTGGRTTYTYRHWGTTKVADTACPSSIGGGGEA